ncbi:MAG TPA: helix-turn-helix domain-containing protein [Bacteroidales bacterium]|jgi:AcrR family transcriptional regulator|nr:helix-turn-helix domain containing protein [Bacteroidales bacterium]MDD4234487.1 helix-turn-helix domain containing protein [Bacteroidales bacterium]MDY0159977.1 helix-turn-helix domain-containing protein [Bacteroidales bacterium]HXK80650.1 helix-turn-helix domain-containing protein [Bacteroidales bacterium]
MEKHEKVRQNLINAARKIFVRFGFEKTTMNEIALEARKGKSSLYYYFASKEEVFQAVVEYEAGIIVEKLKTAVNNSETLIDKARNFILVRFAEIQKLGNLYNALRDDFLNHLEFIKKARVQYDMMELNFIKALLNDGKQQRIFDINDIDTIAETFQMTLKAVELPLLIDYESEVFETRLNSLVDIFFYGILTRNDE